MRTREERVALMREWIEATQGTEQRYEDQAYTCVVCKEDKSGEMVKISAMKMCPSCVSEVQGAE